MASYLMTHSLLASWLYTMKENPYEDALSTRDSFQEFLQTLRREPIPPNEAMQNGIDFEDLITDILELRPTAVQHDKVWGKDEFKEKRVPVMEHKWFEPACKVANIIRNGQLQYKAKKLVQVNGMDILLYGRLDALKAGTIYDIKFSKGYDKGKYIDSTQHRVYLELIQEAEAFTYIVSDGKSVWTETYHRYETPEICPMISDFIDWLNVMDLMDTYKEYWKSL